MNTLSERVVYLFLVIPMLSQESSSTKTCYANVNVHSSWKIYMGSKKYDVPNELLFEANYHH